MFGAHVRADDAQTAMTWKVTMANPTSDQNMQFFRYWVAMKRGQTFNHSDVTWSCNTDDEFAYGIYSFPQNLCKKHVTTNIRRKEYYSDFDDIIIIDLGAPVDDFNLMDHRVNMTTTDNQHFVVFFDQKDTPRGDAHAHELHMEWNYRYGQFFLSNTVTVQGYSYDEMDVDSALAMGAIN